MNSNPIAIRWVKEDDGQEKSKNQIQDQRRGEREKTDEQQKD